MALVSRSSHLVAAAVLGISCVAGAATASAHQSLAPVWATTKAKTVNLTIVAAYDDTTGGFNFNGASNGKMTITVPLGDRVNVTFSNNAPLPHSAQFVAFSKTPPATSVLDAFTGAHSPSPTTGVMKGTTQKFSFVANKAGTYLLICAVPGHDVAGMWDVLTVSKTAKAASVVVHE